MQYSSANLDLLCSGYSPRKALKHFQMPSSDKSCWMGTLGMTISDNLFHQLGIGSCVFKAGYCSHHFWKQQPFDFIIGFDLM